MDDVDKASEGEIFELSLRLKAAANKIVTAPDLGCEDCSGISQIKAKTSCQHFTTCISDWQKLERMNKITGTK
jgi:hypothetical protein